MSDEYKVYAIKYLDHRGTEYTAAVSAESEYGAVKRFCANRVCRLLAVVETDLVPQWEERRIEGHINYLITEEDETTWQYGTPFPHRL